MNVSLARPLLPDLPPAVAAPVPAGAVPAPLLPSLPAPPSLRRLGRGIEWLGRLSPALATRVLWRLWFTPQQVRPNARAREVLASADSLVEVYGGREGVLVHSWGQGPAVLLLHGWSGYGGQLGSFVAPLLAAGHRVLLFDAPAHGPNPRREFTLPEYVDLVTAVLQHAGPVRAIVGHSLGATAGAIALRRHGRPLDFVGIAASANLATLLAGFRQRLGLSETRLDGLRAAFEAQFGADVWQAYSLDHHLPQLPGRVLLVHDRDDADAPYANSLYLQFLREDAALQTTRGLGHNRILHDPGVIAAVRDFLSPPRGPVQGRPARTGGAS